ncbi:MAG: UDP-N-acetylmuramate dehydrogenase [Candidatus Omnitrophota bacterium]
MKKSNFPKIKGNIIFNEPLFKHNTFRTGGNCSVWVEPKGEEDLREVLAYAGLHKKKIFVIGSGSNVLFKDKGFSGIVVKLGKGFKKINFSGGDVVAGGAVGLPFLVNASCRRGLAGMEALVGIPGTVGGAIFMNAGSAGRWMSDLFSAIKVIDMASGVMRYLTKDEVNFSYRKSNLNKYIVVEAAFRLKKAPSLKLVKQKNKLLALKRKKQPLSAQSAGCFFKNPAGKMTAAQYIERLGLKGRRFGKAEISNKHANFIVGTRGVKTKDIMRLAGLAKRMVKSHFKVDLVPEITIL